MLASAWQSLSKDVHSFHANRAPRPFNKSRAIACRGSRPHYLHNDDVDICLTQKKIRGTSTRTHSVPQEFYRQQCTGDLHPTCDASDICICRRGNPAKHDGLSRPLLVLAPTTRIPPWPHLMESWSWGRHDTPVSTREPTRSRTPVDRQAPRTRKRWKRRGPDRRSTSSRGSAPGGD